MQRSGNLPKQANILSGLAGTVVFFGVLGAFLIVVGAADGPRLAPAAICVLAGVLAAGYYGVRRQPLLAAGLLNIASVLLLFGALALTTVLQAGA